MPTEVLMPQMGESIFEGTITKWLKKPGDTVQRDEPLFEISTDKVDAEIPSPAAGVLTEIRAQEGSTVQVNAVVGVIGDGASAAASAPAAPAQRRQAEAPKAQPAAPPPAAETKAGGHRSGPRQDVVMPQMGESIFEGTITKWLKNVGDTVQRDEPLFEISTDKVDAEIPVARRRRAHRDQSSCGPGRADQHRRRRDWWRGRSCGSRQQPLRLPQPQPRLLQP